MEHPKAAKTGQNKVLVCWEMHLLLEVRARSSPSLAMAQQIIPVMRIIFCMAEAHLPQLMQGLAHQARRMLFLCRAASVDLHFPRPKPLQMLPRVVKSRKVTRICHSPASYKLQTRRLSSNCYDWSLNSNQGTGNLRASSRHLRESLG